MLEPFRGACFCSRFKKVKLQQFEITSEMTPLTCKDGILLRESAPFFLLKFIFSSLMSVMLSESMLHFILAHITEQQSGTFSSWLILDRNLERRPLAGFYEESTGHQEWSIEICLPPPPHQ